MSGYTIRTWTYLLGTAFVDGQSAGSITPGDVRDFIGTTENAVQTVAANSKSGASYTIALSDSGAQVEMTNASANTVYVPTNSSVAFPIGTVLQVFQYGAGQTTIAAVTPATTTIRTPSSVTARAQYSTIMLRKRGTDEWVLGGDLT